MSKLKLIDRISIHKVVTQILDFLLEVIRIYTKTEDGKRKWTPIKNLFRRK